MCFLSRGPVSRTSISQRMRGDSMVNVDPSSLVITVPGAVYSALFMRTVASRMFSTGALNSFFLPFLVMSLPTVMDLISYLNPRRERRPVVCLVRLVSVYFLATGRTTTMATGTALCYICLYVVTSRDEVA